MKKILVLILLAGLLLTSFLPSAAAEPLAAQPAGQGGSEKVPSGETAAVPLDYTFLPAGAQWQELAAGEAPAEFGATYELAEGVLVVGEEVTKSIASAGQLLSGGAAQKLLPNKIIAEGGYVPEAVLDAAAEQQGRTIKNGTVVVDESAGTAFKVVSQTEFTGAFDTDPALKEAVKSLEGNYAIAQPQLQEVLKDFNLGGEEGETVSLTRGNISGFAPNVEKNLVQSAGYQSLSFGDSQKDFQYLSDDPLMELQFENERLDAWLGDGSPIYVNVSGGLGVDQIDVTARYTASDGYRLTMTLNQESYLVVEMEAEVAEQIIIPMFGIHVSVKAGDKEIARIAGGVFVIVEMDGTLKLEVETREFTSNTAGVRGSTKFYIPTSIHPVTDNSFESDGEVDLYGDIDGSLKFGPMLKLDVFGFKLVGAGAFMGVGVHVEADNHYLNVELYGILNVYIDFLGKHLNLVNLRPTILTRRQADLAGFQVTFLETYVYPGRVGGILKKDPPGAGEAYMVAKNIPYRILVVPAGETFDPNIPGDVEKTAIRKYPASGYALTNEEGEFIQEEEGIVGGGELAMLEFQVDGKSYFTDPVSPTLPFEKAGIGTADYFNDYVTGQVQPIRVINWDAPSDAPAEEQYEWAYYANGLITLNPYLSTTWNVHIPYGGQARTMTDEKGYFDTRNTLYSLTLGQALPNAYFDVYENMQSYGNAGGFDFRLDYNGAVSGDRIAYKTTSPLLFTRMVEEVPDSYMRYEEGGKIIDRMVYDEYIWIVNPSGTRTVTEEEFSYSGGLFSTQDYWEWDGSQVSSYDLDFTANSIKLVPVLDEEGNPTGATLFSQRVTVEWVWQEHPNPLIITSADHGKATAAGGSFQVTAEGYAPFSFTLEGAPAGVAIQKDTGLLTFPAGMEEKDYTFTIRAAENRTQVIKILGSPDPYEGNDPSLPAEQLFTLTIGQPSPTDEPGGIAPKIASERHGYRFSMPAGGGDFTKLITASGSVPITWTVIKTSGYPLPTEVSVAADTGVLTVKGSIAAGSYYFTLKAENVAGSDTQPCTLIVAPARTAPVISEEEHGYSFTKLINGGDLVVPITAVGSAPITWSLEQVDARHLIPAEVTIDPATGVLTVKEGISKGSYPFIVRAENDVGVDTQECALVVASLSDLPGQPHLSASPAGKDETALLAVLAKTETLSQTTELSVTQPPLNAVTLRYDDPKDVYTNDRYLYTVNGALYVRWHATPMVLVSGTENYSNSMEAYTAGDVQQTFYDTSPRCDNYHYRSEPLPEAIQEKIEQLFKEQLTDYQKDDIFRGQELNAADLLAGMNNFSVNQMEDGFSYLEYGSLLDEMAAGKGGSFQVELNDLTGTIVTGKYFIGLKDNKSAQLSFEQAGAVVTFAGKDVKAASEYDMLDFGYYAGAFSEQEMLAAAGGGGESFTFAFAYHGALPGIAAFSIETDIAEGSSVNVYKFDAATGGFTLIAADLTVGAQGVVTYKNNTMSEYLITTETLAGAEVSDMAGRQGSGGIWLWLAGLCLVAAAGGAVILIVKRRKKQKAGDGLLE